MIKRLLSAGVLLLVTVIVGGCGHESAKMDAAMAQKGLLAEHQVLKAIQLFQKDHRGDLPTSWNQIATVLGPDFNDPRGNRYDGRTWDDQVYSPRLGGFSPASRSFIYRPFDEMNNAGPSPTVSVYGFELYVLEGAALQAIYQGHIVALSALQIRERYLWGRSTSKR